jgi:N-methylhydantoinase A
VRLRIGIDTGGTFTDVVALDEDTGQLVTTKTPSTPADPSQAFLTGIDKVLGLAGADGSAVTTVLHGTTVATNALLQGEVTGLGFLTTEGFRHVLEIGRQSVPDGYGNSYFWVKPDRIVPLHLVREVPERLDHTGAVVRELDEAAVVQAARWFEAAGVRTIGVCLLHAYVNPDHERRVRDILLAEHPGCWVSISSDVLREYREYERSVTTLVDAFVKPPVAAYVAALSERLHERMGDGVPFLVMKSNGGVASAQQIGATPISTVLSGPAAGALGAAIVTGAAGFDRVVTLDGGGTSTDVAVIRDGRLTLTSEGTVGRFPAKVPMIDIVTVGAGGGSIAWVSPEGGLKVGPRSAGADPGPLCYGKGGLEPTLTDAAVVLGRIPPHLLGGEVPLDVVAARAGYERLSAELGLEPEACAAGVMEIWAWNQANAIRQMTVRRGLDVRDFAITAFGGSGPLQACRLVDILGAPAALVPRDPGNVCAFGLLTVDVRLDDVRTLATRGERLDHAALEALYQEMEGDAAERLRAEGFKDDDHRFLRAADMRYDGQAYEVRVDAPDGPVDAPFVATVIANFHDEHERLYGYCYRDDPGHGVECVNLRATAVGPLRSATLATLEPGTGAVAVGSRPMWVGTGAGDGAWADAALFDRATLGSGDVVDGPAVIEEFGSTLPVLPGFRVTVDHIGNLVLRRADPHG